jgi:sec-independent protein translocase protein TatB
MFDIGFWELAILCGLGLVILGPEKLPRVASQIGNWAGQARRMARNLSSQMQAEVDLSDPFKTSKPVKTAKAKTPQEVKPAWQTSAGLRPGYSSENEAAEAAEAAEEELPEDSGHQEYDPATDPDHPTAAAKTDTNSGKDQT